MLKLFEKLFKTNCKPLTSRFSTIRMETDRSEVSPSFKFVGESPIKDLCKSPTNRPFRVAIEGNIGAGKSTLIEYFRNTKGIETYGEPIEWWRNVHGYNLLDLMYSNPSEWLKVFQSYVQLTRLQVQTSRPQSPQTTVQIFERSIQNNRFCFVEVAHKNGSLTGPDFAVLDEWYRWCAKNVNIDLDLIVYLRSSPQVVFNRMRARARPEEESVPLEYLQQLHEAHEDWLMTEDGYFDGIPVLVFDADKTLEDIREQYKLNEERILGYDKRKSVVERVKRNLDGDFM